ncbi:CotH kinase family protein [Psychromonas sp.]|nr:CotH kinase family protein [Psychromonas sp.]
MIVNIKDGLFFELSKFIKLIFASMFIYALLLLSGCAESDSEVSVDSDENSIAVVDDADFEVADWTDETHSKNATPNFDEVFDSSQVKRLDMIITEENWQSMLDDMTALYGEFGQSEVTPPMWMGGPPEAGNPVEDLEALVDDTEDPIFVPGDIYYNGIQWYKVGLRFKGNSSLKSSWEQGILKLSFKLDFDEYEDDYPQIKNQRFYGFKKLSLKNNYEDQSLIREKVAADVFASAGLAVSHTAFYELYVDHGEGPIYFGLYTLVEEVDDTVIDEQFSSDQGNLYKPEGDGASFSYGSFSETYFEKKTNEDDADWSDIETLFTALHADQVDPALWRENLDAIFDTDVFLKYLAVNGLIQNWDTYGRMTHNFYLYNDPSTGKLTWIPWDNNEALQEGKLGGSLALDFTNLESVGWPLIEKMMADEVYKAQYDEYLYEVMFDAFEVSKMQALYDYYADMVESYAAEEAPEYSFLNGQFYDAITALKVHVSERTEAAELYLYQ